MSDLMQLDESTHIEPISLNPACRDALVTRESQTHSLFEEMNGNAQEPVENILRVQLRFLAANMLLNENDCESGSRSLTYDSFVDKVQREVVGDYDLHMRRINEQRAQIGQESLVMDAFEETRAIATIVS